jgi:predicted transglutaminase-like cysteine proteinase
LPAAALLCRLLLAALLWAPAGPATAWDRDRMQAAAQALGPRAQAGLALLQPLLHEAATQSDGERVKAINRFFNQQLQFREDIDLWGVVDYWASPLEALSRGAGDCEDYAIAKYFSLVASGVPVNRLRLVYVRARFSNRVLPHMVLAYYPSDSADPLILDNLRDELLPASKRADLEPVFSFNSEGLWKGVGSARDGDPVVRLSRWREILVKAQAEGFL